MTTDLFKSIYITMRLYTTIIQTKSITWTSSQEVQSACKWALYSSEGCEYVSQTTYYEEFLNNCQLIRQYISSTDIPSDFVPNAYAYLLHALFCKTDNPVHHRELALRIFSTTITSVNQTSYQQLLDQLRLSIDPRRAFSHAHRCLLEALVTITLCLPKHFDFLFELLHDFNGYDQLCQLIIETVFKRSDLSGSYDCLASLKIDRIIDTLNECSFGAYVILKLILKNRVPFVKGLNNSLAWHSNIFGRFSFVFANATYEPIRAVLIEICHDTDIQQVLMKDLF